MNCRSCGHKLYVTESRPGDDEAGPYVVRRRVCRYKECGYRKVYGAAVIVHTMEREDEIIAMRVLKNFHRGRKR